jgi:hypothetical protein
MKKTIITLVVAACTLSNVMAQKEVKYTKLYYKETKAEVDGLIIAVEDAVSLEGETKFKLKITNPTNNYYIYKPEESTFVVNGKESKPKEKWVIIHPNDSEHKVITLKGTEFNKVKNYSFVVGGLYKVVLNAKGAEAPDFKLPPSQNDFKAGNFNCSLGNFHKETDGTEAKFNCSYDGANIGFVFPAKVAVKMPDGNEYANAKSKAKPIIMMKGDTDHFTLIWDRMQGGKEMDMQKVEMIIKWHDTFVEGTPEKVKAQSLQLEFDEAKSNEKGK